MILRLAVGLRMAALGMAGMVAIGSALAEQFTSDIDPACRLPRLNLLQPADDSLYELLAADDPSSSTWESVLSVAPGGTDHSWHDPAARTERLRFYRWKRIQPRPPLAPTDNFRLVDHLGVSHELMRDGDAAAIVLVFTDNASLPATWAALSPVRAWFADGSVRFWIVNPKDARGDLAPAAQAAGVTVPVLHDAAQLVARTYHAGNCGEAVAIDPATMEELYRGAIDDDCVVNGANVRQEFLKDALSLHRAGLPVRVTRTRPQGASLGLDPVPVPGYATEVAPLLRRSCVKCHRPGDIGSFAMTNHASVLARVASMRWNLVEGRMPPWHADAPRGTFSNDSSLSPDEAARLLAWADAGAPRGDGEDPLVVEPPAPAVDWPLGPPDVVMTIPVQQIPSFRQAAAVPYRYITNASPFPTNVWLRAAVVRPANRQVVHHALVFAGSAQDLAGFGSGLGGFFAGYVPGVEQDFFPDGLGKQLKAGSLVVFQMHYTPRSTAQTDATELGLYLAAAPPARELKTGAAFNLSLFIGPGQKSVATFADKVFARASTIYEMSPHMHLRGASMRFDAIYPDHTVHPLLNVPNYDFAWQTMYRLAQPVTVPAGTRLRVSGTFDNSVWNPYNPDASRAVYFGEQTTDEMFIGYVNYAEN